MRACESEDLPAVPGAPRPAVHRLVEWAFGLTGCGSAPAGCAPRFVLGCASAGGDHPSTRRIRTAQFAVVNRSPPPSSDPRASAPTANSNAPPRGTGRGGPAEQNWSRSPPTLRRDTWAAAGRRRAGLGTGEHLLLLRPDARHRGHARRAAGRGSPAIADELDRYFAAARGTDDIAPLEMTKWFDTNYHYIVPEIGPGHPFALQPGQGARRAERGARARDSRAPGDHRADHLPAAEQGASMARARRSTRLDELVPLYAELLG